MTHFSSQQQYYDRVFEWVLDVRRIHSQEYVGPMFIALNGPQGSGKSTLTKALVERAEEMSIKMVSLSIDDFYLSRSEQVMLEKSYSHNRFLHSRGYPGTHDIGLGLKTLRKLQESEEPVKIPRYDKSAFEGKGDRLPKDQWETIGPDRLEVIFIEGWMLGFRSLPSKELEDCFEMLMKDMPLLDFEDDDKESFREINNRLKDYRPWNQYFDAFIRLRIEDYSLVVDWRTQAEASMKAQGKPGMSEAEVKAYAEMFLPAYEVFADSLSHWEEACDYYLGLELDKNRMPAEF